MLIFHELIMNTDPNILQSLALAVLQGITEFLPVSSSGHLVLARHFFGWSDRSGLVVDTVLHGGSLLAILIYFWREWIAIFRGYFSDDATDRRYYRRLPWLLLVATIPAAVVGPLLKPLLESDAIMRNSAITGMSMIMTALLFLLVEYRPEKTTGEKIGFIGAFLTGLMQVVALLPGASRSGWTTGGGMLCGQSRESSVRFAFLMVVPAIAGALVLQSREILKTAETGAEPALVLAEFVVSFLVSLGAIHFCLKYFRAHSLRPFAIYLVLLGLLAIIFK